MSTPNRILVVDDEAIVGRRLKPALEKSGYAVEICAGGTEAIARLSEASFDVVVTDMRMDDVDGMQVLEHVMVHSPATRVILMTGYATVELAREALVKGAFDFIAKPFRPDDLREVIARCLKATNAASGPRAAVESVPRSGP